MMGYEGKLLISTVNLKRNGEDFDLQTFVFAFAEFFRRKG
jgi:hypothetical protein